ncbi:MAG TPA: cbb3-type cytochrome oxidase assembly protein CcoS, partial [Campylobacterales bacterium]|nr:cbb3-type cytochrome oxidase assembly protein CcoS [Campylobacterales bacterium]
MRNLGNRTYELIVIGGGPGGLATAIEGRYLGISDTLILEKGHSHSMTIRDYYKDGKRVDKDWKGAKVDLVGNIQFTDGTKETTLELFDHLIAEHQLDIKYRSDVEAISRVDNYFRVLDTSGNVYFAKNVVIAIGSMGKPNKPDYP